MKRPVFIVFSLINQESFVKTIIDIEYFIYFLYNSRFAIAKALKCIQISPKEIEKINKKIANTIKKAMSYYLDINGHQEMTYIYIIPLFNNINIILKSLWIRKQNVKINKKKKKLKIKSTNTIVYNTEVVQNARIPI